MARCCITFKKAFISYSLTVFRLVSRNILTTYCQLLLFIFERTRTISSLVESRNCWGTIEKLVLNVVQFFTLGLTGLPIQG